MAELHDNIPNKEFEEDRCPYCKCSDFEFREQGQSGEYYYKDYRCNDGMCKRIFRFWYQLNYFGATGW